MSLQINLKAFPLTVGFLGLLWAAIGSTSVGLAGVAIGALLFWGAPWVPASGGRSHVVPRRHTDHT